MNVVRVLWQAAQALSVNLNAAKGLQEAALFGAKICVFCKHKFDLCSFGIDVHLF